MLDGSVSKNATTKVLDEKFRAGSADDDEPKIDDVKAKTFTEIHVTFDEENALDAATALDISNYSFEDNELEVLSAEFEDEDDNGNTYDGRDGSNGTVGKDPTDITVILTVSEMDDEENSYKLIIENIADNFGNVMEKAEKETVRVPSEMKTYSVVKDVEVVDLETIKVKFDEEVRDASAEDPTNYVIDGGIGAVKEADLKSDDKTVELTVPKLTANKTYEVTVNNVENYWGYVTEDSSRKFVAVTDDEDTTEPEVSSVDYDNFGVLSITFDEPMDPTVVETSSLLVSTTEKDTIGNSTALKATAMADDDETIIYDATKLSSGKDYYIIGFTSAVKDKANNLVDYDNSDDDFATDDDAFNAADDAIECDGLNQEDGRTIYATFSERVLVDDGTTIEAFDSKGKLVYTFDAELNEDDDQLVELTLPKGKDSFDDEDEDLVINFAKIKTGSLTDLVGRKVKSEDIDVTVDNDDESAPTVDDVVLIDNETVKIYFDEPLREAGKYKIIDLDDDDDVLSVSVGTGFDVGDDVVKLVIKTSDALTADHSYELTMTRAPEDLAGNDFEDYDDYEYEFVGTDLEPEDDFLAVRALNPSKLSLTNDGDYDPGDEENELIFNSNLIDSSKVTINDVVAKREYDKSNDEIILYLNPQFSVTEKGKYTIEDKGYGAVSQSFKGAIEPEVFETTTNAGTAVVIIESSSLKYDTEENEFGVAFVENNSKTSDVDELTVKLILTGTEEDGYSFHVSAKDSDRNFVEGDKFVIYAFDKDVDPSTGFVIGTDVVKYVSPVITVQ